MSRKIRLVGIGLIVLIFLAGLISACVVSSRNIGEVQGLEVVSVTSDTAQLKWKKIGSADGYNIYKINDEEQVSIATIEDKKTVTYTVEELEDCTENYFVVKGYKKSGKKIRESKKFTTVKATTLPLKQSVKLSTITEGAIKIILTNNEKCRGYTIEYCEKDSFDSDVQALDVDDPATTTLDILSLDIGKEYFVRGRSVAEINGNVIYGEWSDVVSTTVKSKDDLLAIDPTKPMIAITFDDGPSYGGASDRILDVIEKYGVRATFFMLGKNALANPANVQRKAALNCEIGNHTYDHSHYGSKVTAGDISSATDAISSVAGGAKVTCFRSPGGSTTDLIRAECQREGLPIYYWTLDTEDWKSRDADAVYDAVMYHVKDGDIVLMHEIYDSTAEAFERMVPALIEQGYQLVTCDELIRYKSGSPAQAGTQYLNATIIRNNT